MCSHDAHPFITDGLITSLPLLNSFCVIRGSQDQGTAPQDFLDKPRKLQNGFTVGRDPILDKGKRRHNKLSYALTEGVPISLDSPQN